jgi:hypothetical protein
MNPRNLCPLPSYHIPTLPKCFIFIVNISLLNMRFAKAVYLVPLAVVHVAAHGLVTRIIGANGVTMPGLTSNKSILWIAPSLILTSWF